MMKYPLNSKFSDRITDFVDYKHSLGHSYEESCRILWKFDLFCCDRFPEKSSFDRDIAMAWLEMRDTEGRTQKPYHGFAGICPVSQRNW